MNQIQNEQLQKGYRSMSFNRTYNNNSRSIEISPMKTQKYKQELLTSD